MEARRLKSYTVIWHSNSLGGNSLGGQKISEDGVHFEDVLLNSKNENYDTLILRPDGQRIYRVRYRLCLKNEHYPQTPSGLSFVV